jgi:hypothetical protein
VVPISDILSIQKKGILLKEDVKEPMAERLIFSCFFNAIPDIISSASAENKKL